MYKALSRLVPSRYIYVHTYEQESILYILHYPGKTDILFSIPIPEVFTLFDYRHLIQLNFKQTLSHARLHAGRLIW